MAPNNRRRILMSIGQIVMDKDRVRYIYQYLFLIAMVFVAVPLVFGPFTTSGFWTNFVIAHMLFVYVVSHKENERAERIRKKRVKDLTQGKG
jgi:uncharacterized membrane protein